MQFQGGGIDHSLLQRIENALQVVQADLLGFRGSTGVWVGELSSCAFSTASAVCALAVTAREKTAEGASAEGNAPLSQAIASGLKWLAANANADGGWGETTLNPSNLTATTAVWAAFGIAPGADQEFSGVVEGAQKWLAGQAGSIDPDRLALAVIENCGRDRHLSAGILSACALAGRLGKGAEAWRRVAPLPFEGAMIPQRFYAALELPAFSYELPTLIALGQVHHHFAASRSPIWRWIRNRLRARTLRVLTDLQPASGGYLEETAQTSFVVMSLAASGNANHAVVRSGVQFLLNAVKCDGSWPVVTNLCVRLTTLSIEALAQQLGSFLSPDEHAAVQEWLLRQHQRQEARYARSRSGGWAWTDSGGGVSHAEDTSSALLALSILAVDSSRVIEVACKGLGWLSRLQNHDGGIPAFCRGWTKLPFDLSSPDLTAHAIRAWTAWRGHVGPLLQLRLDKGIKKALRYLSRKQGPGGEWIPVWDGYQRTPQLRNATYETAQVLAALATLDLSTYPAVATMMFRGVRWLVHAQNANGGWGGQVESAPSVEETALGLRAAFTIARTPWLSGVVRGSAKLVIPKALGWLLVRVETGSWRDPTPIRRHIGKAWYYESLYPRILTAAALSEAAQWAHGVSVSDRPPPAQQSAR